MLEEHECVFAVPVVRLILFYELGCTNLLIPVCWAKDYLMKYVFCR